MTPEGKVRLSEIALALVENGILAADESAPTINKRFDTIGVESTEESRRAYRELLFSTPGIENFISGVILFEETLNQQDSTGTPFPEALSGINVIPGIKVDRGIKDLPGFPGEKITEGLDGLQKRLVEFRSLGARFAKWRAVITIGPGIPTSGCILANAEALARYAALCQAEGLVPIVEPEVLMDADNDLALCEEVTGATLRAVFSALYEHRVFLEGMLLKPNMIISGKKCPNQASPEEIAEATLRCFSRYVPAAVPGIVFLSGGQSPVQATENLNEINDHGYSPVWETSFSYGRALQKAALELWRGLPENTPAAQGAFIHRARCVYAARKGNYHPQMELDTHRF